MSVRPSRRLAFSYPVAAGFAVLLSAGLIASMAAPPWWSQRGVIDSNKTTDDFAPLNQGQLKHMASMAYDEIAARLAAHGGIGDMTPPDPQNPSVPPGIGWQINDMVQGFRDANADPNYPKDYLALVNLGQLKATAKPFWVRLNQLGLGEIFAPGGYPWTVATEDDDNYAIANQGQAKTVFSFDFDRDTDGEGITDWEELLGGTSPWHRDTDGDGFNDQYELVHLTDPTTYTGPNLDFDVDGLLNDEEPTHGTDPAWKDHPVLQLSAFGFVAP